MDSRILIVAVLILPTLLAAVASIHSASLWWDEAVYLGLSKSLQSGHYWLNAPGNESFRPPLLPAILAVFPEQAHWLLPPIFTFLAVLAAFYLGRSVSREAGLWTSLLVGTNSLFLFFASKLLTEALFITLTTTAFLFLLKAMKKGKPIHFVLFGVLAGLTFLTRYAGALLILAALILFLKEKKLKQTHYWLFPFLLVLIPWIFLGLLNFGNPLGALFQASQAVDGSFFSGGPEFYLVHWIPIFGFLGLLAIPGLLAMKKKVPLALVLVLSLGFFTLLPRKEERYLLHFLPFYALFFSLGITRLKEKIPSKMITTIILILMAVSLYSGITLIQGDPGQALKQASLSIQTSGKIMTNALPLVHYYSGKEIVEFPEKPEDLEVVIQEEVTHLLINVWEPSYPEWVWSDGVPSKVFDSFILEGVFEEFGNPSVWVYRV